MNVCAAVAPPFVLVYKLSVDASFSAHTLTTATALEVALSGSGTLQSGHPRLYQAALSMAQGSLRFY